MQRISAVMVLLLALVMAGRSLGYLGIDLSFGSNTYEVSEIREDGYQVVQIDVKSGSYQRIVVQKDIPVRFILRAEEGKLNGCNNAIIIPEFSIEKRLSVGETTVMFTPTEEGTYGYSCWMSMIKSQILVVANLEEYEE